MSEIATAAEFDTSESRTPHNGGKPADPAAYSVVIGDVSVVYPSARGRAPVQALHQVNLSLHAGEFVSIVGPSGCGKSTLLMAVAGLQRPTSGTIELEGENLVRPSSLTGLAFQRDNLLEWRSVLDNVLVQIELRGGKRSSARGRARELLAMVGLEGFEHRFPRELSGGMRQRVSLCRAVVHEPRLLLLDEPFGAVDAMTREQLNYDVSRLCALTGITALLVTHDINEAAFMGDRVVVMTSRPGQVADIIEVKPPTPRDAAFRESPESLDATRRIRAALESGSHVETNDHA